jgi:hypothetical protein
MIVKVERHNKEQDWWLMDNIAKISCSKREWYSQTVTPSILSEDNIVLLDHHPKCDCDIKNRNLCKECVLYYRLICRTKDHYEFSIVFDTVAYICNDDGKTVEKIVANYKD